MPVLLREFLGGQLVVVDEHDVVTRGRLFEEPLQAAGSLEVTPGLRTQLRMLAQDADDEVASAAEELLGSL